MFRRQFVRMLPGAVVVMGLASACNSPSSAPPAQTPASVSTPIASGPAAQTAGSPAPATMAPVQIADDLPALPPGANNAARPVAIVKAAYEFAARHPEVLEYMPCFCACPQMGHKNNDDCFVGGRDPKGRVTAWEYHGMGCEVCIDVAYQAMQMHNSGASTAAIRDAIDKKYDTYHHSHTPTPMPPKVSGAPQQQR
jgi:hypothetical protein